MTRNAPVSDSGLGDMAGSWLSVISLRSEIRNQKSEVRGQKFEIRDLRFEISNSNN